MEQRGFFSKIKGGIETVLPMTFGNFLLFLFILYLLFIVGRSVWLNYGSNKDLDVQRQKVVQLQSDVDLLEMEIAYYKTQSFKEKEARAKLGYMAPGEKVVSLSVDKPEDRIADQGKSEPSIKTPNYQNWINYFFN